MPEFEIAAHCRYRIGYHIVWIVKYRKMLLAGDLIVQRLVEVLYEIGRNYEIPVEEIGTDGDHLHLFCQGIPSIPPCKVVEIYKSISARIMMKEFPELRKRTFGAGLWGVGYYLAFVGHSSTESPSGHI